jgi:hypothetical protein
MLGLWTPNAVRGAEEQFGRRYFRWLVGLRVVVRVAPVLVAVWLLVRGYRWVAAAELPAPAAPSWPSWGAPALVVGGFVAVGVALVVRRVRRGYRLPSRWSRY